jgi:transposase InsO family protein
MSRKGCPRDNAQAESFFRTLKVEEVYLQEYASFAQASACIAQFIEGVYNEKRLHSALGYLPPAEFERRQAPMQSDKANSPANSEQTR